MDLFNSDTKKEALKQLEITQKMYESTGRRGTRAVLSLYKKRKEAVMAIESSEKFLKRQPDFGLDNIKKVANARASIRLFTETLVNEKKNSLNAIDASIEHYTSVAMAFATTFGSAATETAFSTLPGHSALAWLGGGMVAGKIISAMTGPIGLAIGTVTAGLSGYSIAKKNSEIANSANELTQQIRRKTKKLKHSIYSISDLCESISNDVSTLNVLMKGTNSNNIITYNYEEIVAIIISLCRKINKKIAI